MNSSTADYVPYVPIVVNNINHLDTVEHIDFRTPK